MNDMLKKKLCRICEKIRAAGHGKMNIGQRKNWNA